MRSSLKTEPLRNLLTRLCSWSVFLMPSSFSEEEVHQFLYEQGLENVIIETPEPDKTSSLEITGPEEADFELWRIIKAKAEAKLRKIDGGIRYGEFLGSKIQL